MARVVVQLRDDPGFTTFPKAFSTVESGCLVIHIYDCPGDFPNYNMKADAITRFPLDMVRQWVEYPKEV